MSYTSIKSLNTCLISFLVALGIPSPPVLSQHPYHMFVSYSTFSPT